MWVVADRRRSASHLAAEHRLPDAAVPERPKVNMPGCSSSHSDAESQPGLSNNAASPQTDEYIR